MSRRYKQIGMFGQSPNDLFPERWDERRLPGIVSDMTGQLIGGQRHRYVFNDHTVRTQWIMCGLKPEYFVSEYVLIEDPNQQTWIHFALWPAQMNVLGCMRTARKLVVLKARQLGMSWLCLSYGLWLMLFRAPSTILLFSLREAEAKELLERIKRMYERLPVWMQARHEHRDSATAFALSNGSRAMAFSTGTGRSYTGTLAILDEADFVPDLNGFLNAVKPTVDGGGQLFLVSTANKKTPASVFKNLFTAARNDRAGEYTPIFLPWSVHPARDEAWYAKTRKEMFAQRGVDDDFLAEYPATPEDALAPEQLDRRIPVAWLRRVFTGEAHFVTQEGRQLAQAPALGQLRVYEGPQAGRVYVIGADPAEGNPNSDDSALSVVDAETWCEVAALAEPVEPAVFAQMIDEVSAGTMGRRFWWSATTTVIRFSLLSILVARRKRYAAMTTNQVG